MSSYKPTLESHPLIAKLGLAGDRPAGVVPLVGFLGPSTCPGHWRIYHGRAFNEFTEVPEAAIVHAEPPRTDADGPTTFYLEEGTRVQITRVETATLTGRFLTGAIARAHLPSSADQADLFGTGVSCVATVCATCHEK